METQNQPIPIPNDLYITCKKAGFENGKMWTCNNRAKWQVQDPYLGPVYVCDQHLSQAQQQTIQSNQTLNKVKQQIHREKIQNLGRIVDPEEIVKFEEAME